MESTSANVLADLATAEADLAQITERLLTMPEGNEREEAQIEKDRLTYRVSYLNGRKRNFDSSELIESVSDILVFEASISSLTLLKTDAETRKAELQAQAPAAA